MDMDCSTVITLKKLIFSGQVSAETADRVVAHLIVCKECQKEYKAYAKEVGIKFDLIKTAKRIYQTYLIQNNKPAPYLTALVNKGKVSISVLNPKDKYQKAFKNNELAIVCQLKAFSDITLEFKDCALSHDKEGSGFGLYLLEQVVKNIDHLESCYKKKEVKRNEKPIG